MPYRFQTTLDVPVALLVFNRPEATQLTFNVVARMRPSHLFLIADGPRAGRTEEIEACTEVRRIITSVDIGCGPKGTHCTGPSEFAELPLGELQLPLQYPDFMMCCEKHDEFDENYFLGFRPQAVAVPEARNGRKNFDSRNFSFSRLFRRASQNMSQR